MAPEATPQEGPREESETESETEEPEELRRVKACSKPTQREIDEHEDQNHAV